MLLAYAYIHNQCCSSTCLATVQVRANGGLVSWTSLAQHGLPKDTGGQQLVQGLLACRCDQGSAAGNACLQPKYCGHSPSTIARKGWGKRVASGSPAGTVGCHYSQQVLSEGLMLSTKLVQEVCQNPFRGYIKPMNDLLQEGQSITSFRRDIACLRRTALCQWLIMESFASPKALCSLPSPSIAVTAIVLCSKRAQESCFGPGETKTDLHTQLNLCVVALMYAAAAQVLASSAYFSLPVLKRRRLEVHTSSLSHPGG